MNSPDDTNPSQVEKYRCAQCGALWRKHDETEVETFSLWDAAQKPCTICNNSPFMFDNLQRVLEGEPDSMTITQEMSDESLARSKADGHVQNVLDDINAETEQEGDASYISGAGSPGKKPEHPDKK